MTTVHVLEEKVFVLMVGDEFPCRLVEDLNHGNLLRNTR